MENLAESHDKGAETSSPSPSRPPRNTQMRIQVPTSDGLADWRAAGKGTGLRIFPQDDHEITDQASPVFRLPSCYELSRRLPCYDLPQSRSIRLHP